MLSIFIKAIIASVNVKNWKSNNKILNNSSQSFDTQILLFFAKCAIFVLQAILMNIRNQFH